MKNKRRARGIEISHWKTGEADDFQALYPEGSDRIEQAFPETGETEMIEEPLRSRAPQKIGDNLKL